MTKQVNRRRFLNSVTAAASSAAFISTAHVASKPKSPLFGSEAIQHGASRIRGRVLAAGGPLKGVPVTDGLNVVPTGPDGTFELTPDSAASFIYITIPSGYQIPTHPTGTARFYHPITAPEMSIEFSLDPLEYSDENHTFFLWADPQTEDLSETTLLQTETVPDLKKITAEKEEHMFGIACGDIMFDHLELYPEYEKAVLETGIPFFQVVGNHDLDLEAYTDISSTQTFRKHFGPEYYSFNRGAVHYVVLNDVFWLSGGYVGYLTERQLRWLEADLALVEPGSTVVVSLHIPVIGSLHVRSGLSRPGSSVAVSNRAALYQLLEPFNAHLLTGHTHENEHVFEQGTHEHVHGAVCGAWWSGPICFDGTPNGYGVYEVRGEELTWYYKSTGLPRKHQMRLYPRGSDPKAQDEFIANIWNWDPSWKVTWYENGHFRGPMARRNGFDPLSVELHLGDQLPAKRPWVEPKLTSHLFYAPVSEDMRNVRVETVDRFGRIFTETLEA